MNELITGTDAQNLKDSILYKLRLNKLDESSRLLQKYDMMDNNGFLTVTGSQAFLDALWQSELGKKLQKEMATELKKIDEKKKGKKGEA